jgi:Fe-S cluster assembly scaffold protein SufB
VVEIVALEDAEVKYSTVQNWYPGDEDGKGGIYNFVTKRADCRGDRAKVMWTQVETGSAITWKYPSCILRGDDSQGEFYSIAITNNWQQADTGTKMIHLGKNTRSRIVSKGIGGAGAEHLSRAGVDAPQGQEQPQLHPVRQPADRRQVRRAYGALYRGQEHLEPGRARGDDLEGR